MFSGETLGCFLKLELDKGKTIVSFALGLFDGARILAKYKEPASPGPGVPCGQRPRARRLGLCPGDDGLCHLRQPLRVADLRLIDVHAPRRLDHRGITGRCPPWTDPVTVLSSSWPADGVGMREKLHKGDMERCDLGCLLHPIEPWPVLKRPAYKHGSRPWT